jgi:O-antigen ligase
MRSPARLRYWRHGAMAALVMFGFIVIRLPELVPVLRVLRPVILASLLVTALFVAYSSRSVRRAALRDPLAKLLLAYAMWAVLTVPFALYKAAAVGGLDVFPFAFVLAGSFLLVEPSVRNLDRIHIGLVAETFVLCAYSLMRGNLHGSGRLTGTGMYDPNDLAALLVSLFPMSLAMLRWPSPPAKAAALATLALQSMVTVATGSRGGLIALVAATLVYYVISHPARLAKVLFGLAIAATLLWRVGPPQFRERARSLMHAEDDYNVKTETGRVAIWKRGLGYFADRPITGLGLHNFPEAEGRHFLRQNKAAQWFPAHNAYLEAAAELGAPGFVLLLGLLLGACSRALPYWLPNSEVSVKLGHRPEYMASVVGFMVAAFFLSLAYSFILFGIVAVAWFAGRVASANVRAPTRAPRAPRAQNQ